MKVLDSLAFGRGILLVIVLLGVVIYWFYKKRSK